ncbi:phage tail tape measure protein [Streptomyces sp. NPDC056053]|uniref:phage tail tape measure protein n=1 Tax=Streptomyces sp. NPDC056053 TaxID=3345696 RepID=UPI0035DD3557
MATYGTAEVRIEADTSDFHRELQRDLQRGRPVEINIEPDARGFVDRLRRDLRRITAEITLRADSRRLVREIERELRRVRPPRIELEVRADTSRAESDIRSIRARDIDVTVRADTSQARSELDDLQNQIPDGLTVPVTAGGAGDAGAAAGGDLISGLAGSLAGAGPWGAVVAVVLAGAALVAKAFTTGVSEYIAGQQITGRFEAQLGSTGADAKKYGATAGRLYAEGVTETADDGARAVQEAVRAGLQLNPGDLDLQGVSTALADLANLMEEDVGQTARAVGQMIKTGLVDNAQQGFDLLTKGVQGGANAAEDLLDTFSEYSTQFRQLGLSGEEALGLIQQGLKGGARDADVVADTLKEFSIEAAQGGERVTEAFKSLNLDATEFSNAFAKGGAPAREALEKVLDSLRNIEDPLKRNQLAVGLFGTKAEDLAGALDKMDLGTAAKQMEGFEGSTTRAGNSLRDNLGTALSRVGREAKLALGGLFSGDVSGFGNFADSVRDLLPYVKEAAKGLASAIEDAFLELVPKIPGLMMKIGTKIGESVGDWGPQLLKIAAIFNLIPVILMAALGTAMVSAVAAVWNTYISPALEDLGQGFINFFSVELPAFFTGIGDSIGAALSEAFNVAWTFVTEQLPVYAQGALDWFLNLPGLIFEALGMLAGLLVAAFVAGFNYLWEQVPVWIENTITFFRDLPGKIGEAISNLGSFLADAFNAAIGFVTQTLPAKIAGIIAFFRRLPGQALAALSDLGSKISSAFSTALSAAQRKVSTGLDNIAGFFRKLPGQITSALSGIGTSMWNGLRAALNAGIRLVNRAVDGFNKFSPVNVSRIPELADGGILYQRTLAYVGEAGPEAVIPLMRPRRAAQLAEQSGLIDLLQKQGLVVRTGTTDRSQTHTWNITTRGADPRALSQSLYNRMTLATGV